MQTKVKKLFKIALCGVGLAAMLILSGIVGMRVERRNQRALELQKVHVDTIAVVNMDNGVPAGGEHVNYASQLMNFPGGNFIVTGLTDAKAGIENGSYAAYIVVPETFSESVTSIESDPQKVTLSCQYGARLDEASRTQAVSDVNAFIALLNSNTAYMYLDAILAEFHRIQDDSSAILANDITELELLASVNADQLIAAAEPVDEVVVDDDIQPVQLETYTAQNQSLLGSMMSGYTEAVQRGKEDYAAIRENNSLVGQAADNFFSTYDSVIQETATEHSALLAAGREKLESAVGAYNMDVEAQGVTVKETIVNLVSLQLASDQAAVDFQLNEIVGDMKNQNSEKLQALQKQWEKAYRTLRTEADASLDQKVEDCRRNLEDLVQDIYAAGYQNGYKESYGNAVDALDDLNRQIESMKQDADADPDLGWDAGTLTEVQDIIGQIKLDDAPQPDIGDHEDGFNQSIEEQLGDIGISWEQLGVVLPPIYGSSGDGAVPDDGDSADNTAVDDGDGAGEVTDPGEGDNAGEDVNPGGDTEDPDPKLGEGEDPDPKPRDGEDPDPKPGDGEDPDPKPGEGEDPDPKPGEGEDPKPGEGEDPDPDPGEDPDPDPDPGEDPDPIPGDDKEYKISLELFEGNEDTIGNAVTETLQLFMLEPQLEEIGNIIQTCFVDALSAESQRQMGRLTDAGQQLNQSMESYESRLESYDPMQYIESADLDTYLGGIESNTGEMMNTVEQNNTEYMLYASEMYATTAEHTTELRSSLDEANNQTTVNVENCINGLISSRQSVNHINVDMLKGFTELLSYTRVESQGNTEVYDHIVNPVTSQVKGQTSASTGTVVSEKGMSVKVWIILILSVGIILCLTEILNAIRRQHGKPKEENRQIL